MKDQRASAGILYQKLLLAGYSSLSSVCIFVLPS